MLARLKIDRSSRLGARTTEEMCVKSAEQSKRVLVTGGAGFLGSHLCERLLAQGNEVVCLDNLSTGQLVNIDNIRSSSKFRFIHQDVGVPIDIEVDQIYNMACPASPPHYQADPIQTTKTNVLGALSVLELARRRNCVSLQASTSEVYGDPDMHPQHESYWGNVNPVGVRSCYDEGKRCAESLFSDYARTYHIPVKIARIFNTYGPRMRPDDGRVVSNFIVQALRGEDVTIYGDGTQTRSLCYVDDLLDGLIRLMNSPATVSEPVNLGNPTEYTVLEIAELTRELTGSRSKIVYMPLPQDDPRRRRPDIGRAERVLGWKPSVPLERGLASTISYFDRLLGGAIAVPEGWHDRDESGLELALTATRATAVRRCANI
jgi:UDP-glucuronate decarboxylase